MGVKMLCTILSMLLAVTVPIILGVYARYYWPYGIDEIKAWNVLTWDVSSYFIYKN